MQEYFFGKVITENNGIPVYNNITEDVHTFIKSECERLGSLICKFCLNDAPKTYYALVTHILTHFNNTRKAILKNIMGEYKCRVCEEHT